MSINIWFKQEKTVKKEIRIMGIDDAPFSKSHRTNVLVLGTIHRGGDALEGVVSTYVQVDGVDATAKLIAMINNTKHKDQLQCIMLDGIAVGGFNVVDICELSKLTNLPVLSIIRHRPNMERVKAALKNVPNFDVKWENMRKAGRVHEAPLSNGNKIYFQCKGVTPKKAIEIIEVSVSHGNMPEPIRTAHIIASGVVEGESKGRA
jgi:endonuclease V-like protein UPF0215 family